MNPNQTPTPEGTLICPAVEGAANFFSTSYNPATGLLLRQHAREVHSLHQDPAAEWRAGRGYSGGGGRRAPDDKPPEVPPRFRHPDRQGRLGTSAGRPGRQLERHSLHRRRPGHSTATMAASSRPRTRVTGKKLWSFPFTESLHTSPMTYMFDHKQYVGMIAGSVVYVFGLTE